MSNNPKVPGRAYPDDARGTETIPDLVRNLANDMSTLFSKELSLAKAEVRQAASDAQKAIAAMAGGAALALAGVIFVLLAVTLLIANALPLWVSSLVVGVVALFVGYVMVKAARPVPTIERVQSDWNRKQIKPVRGWNGLLAR